MSNPLAIIQARVESSRLPGKVLEEIGGHPLIEHVVRRTHRAIPNPVLAIPDTSANDRLEQLASGWPCQVVRGPEENVLARFKKTLKDHPDADPILRVTGDNPLISPVLMEKLPDKLGKLDWAAWRYLPFGIGNSVFTRKTLTEGFQTASTDEHREHVTLHIRRNTDYDKKHFLPPQDYRAPGFRLTVDTEQDLKLIREIHDQFDTGPFGLSVPKVLDLLTESPELARINRSIDQKVYAPTDQLLYTFNAGDGWGSGHKTRFQTIHRQAGNNLEEIVLFGLQGNSHSVEQVSDDVVADSSQPLDQPTVVKWARRTNADTVVQDVKHSGADLVKSLIQEGRNIIGIEERGAGRQYMDAVIDPNLYEDTLDEDSVDQKSRYYGPDYALIDPSFRQHQRSEAPRELDKLGIFMGGTDPNHLGPTVVDTASRRIDGVELHYFGPHDLAVEDGNGRTKPEESTLKEDNHSPNNQGKEPRVIRRGLVDNPARTFSGMDMMIISGGVVKFEIACLNLPAMIIPQNEEQFLNSRRFIKHCNLNWPLFNHEDSVGHRDQFFKTTSFHDRLEHWSKNVSDTVDGRGLERFFTIIDDVPR